MKILHIIVFCAVWTLLCFVPAISSEIIHLIDGNKMSGDIEHYYRGDVTIKIDGKEVVIPRSKIKTIEFKLPAPKEQFSTPEKTFNIWQNAVKKEDINAVVECYALMYQGIIKEQMESMNTTDRMKIKQDMEATTLEIQDSKVTGNKASLKILRKFKGETQTITINFVKENNEWKMTP